MESKFYTERFQSNFSHIKQPNLKAREEVDERDVEVEYTVCGRRTRGEGKALAIDGDGMITMP